ncbi:MAG: restriction endonuclease [Candidatus Sulfotelmatobacter sp.]
MKGFERAMTMDGLGYGGPYYVENLTIQCLLEMARVQGWNGPHPGEYLYKWKNRASSEGVKQLTEFVEGRLRSRLSDLQAEEKTAQKREEEGRFEVYRQWLDSKRALLNKFLEVAERRVSLLDDYGDEKWDALPKEIDRFLLKIAQTETDEDAQRVLAGALKEGEYMLPEKYCWLKSRLAAEFATYHAEHRMPGPADFENFSGTDFEAYLAKLLRDSEFEDICGTGGSGDQGADLVARKGGKKIVIQAKCWRGPVGNKAVQEVAAAVKFYGADEGWVITTGTFTPSAKALAQKNNVRLIDGFELRKGL